MRLASYIHKNSTGFGIVSGDGLIDLGSRSSFTSLKQALPYLADVKKYATEKADVKLADVQLLPPIRDPGKILCIGINYFDHLKETGAPRTENPTVFTRFADTQVGHGGAMVRPKASVNFDYEGELAVIIGRGGRHIPESEAKAAVAGYSCFNDGSIRDWQNHTSQFIPGKNFPATGGSGPYLVTPDEVPNIESADLKTRLNGVVVQHANTSDLIFSIPRLIAYCSTFTQLSAGDIIITGTTGGVGAYHKPPLWMKPGDIVEVEIEGVGLLRNSVVQET